MKKRLNALAKGDFPGNPARLLAVVLWMSVIFVMSGQNGEESGGLSLNICLWFSERIANVGQWAGLLTADGRDSLIALLTAGLHGAIRKTAHVCEYWILGILLYRWGRSFLSRSMACWMTMILGVLYAISDECHQLFVSGRSGQISDVLIDSCGLCLALMTARLFRRPDRSAAIL